MATAREVWPDVPADWDPKAPGDADDFAVDCTEKLAERSATIAGTPTFAAYLPDAPTTPVNDLTFSSISVTANTAGEAARAVSLRIAGGTDGETYFVAMTFIDSAGRTLVRGQLLAVEDI